jgi:hypothetical protein
MKIQLEREELAVIVLHMKVMRKSIKKGMKANYGIVEGRKKMIIYDQLLKERLSNSYCEEIDRFSIKLTAEEVDMLSSFLNWYVEELKLSAEDQDFNPENNEVLGILERAKEKVLELDEQLTDRILDEIH